MAKIEISNDSREFMQVLFLRENVDSILGDYIKFIKDNIGVPSKHEIQRSSGSVMIGTIDANFTFSCSEQFTWYEYYSKDFLTSLGLLNNYQGSSGSYWRNITEIVPRNLSVLKQNNFSDLENVKQNLNNLTAERVKTHAETESAGDVLLTRLIENCSFSCGRLLKLADIIEATALKRNTKLKPLDRVGVRKLSEESLQMVELYTNALLLTADKGDWVRYQSLQDYINSVVALLFHERLKQRPLSISCRYLVYKTLKHTRPNSLTYDNRIDWVLTVAENLTNEMIKFYGVVSKPDFKLAMGYVPYTESDVLSLNDLRLSSLVMMSGAIVQIPNVRLFMLRTRFDEITSYIFNEFRRTVEPPITAKRLLIALLLYCIRQRTNTSRVVERQTQFTVTFDKITYTFDVSQLLDKLVMTDRTNELRQYFATYAHLASELCRLNVVTKDNLIWRDMYGVPDYLNFDFVKYIDPTQLSIKDRACLVYLNKRFSKNV